MDINGFKNGYKPTTDRVKNDKGNQVLHTHRILSRWRNHFSQLLNIRGINVVRDWKTYSRATSAWAQCLWIWNVCWKDNKTQLTHVLIKFQQNWLKWEIGQLFLISINSLILPGIWRNCPSSGCSRPLDLFIRRMMTLSVVIEDAYHFRQLYKMKFNYLLSRWIPCAEEIIWDR